MVKATISADGIVEKPDVVGAIFGQTEGLLGNELDLRDLQKSGRIGRIEVEIDSKKGKSTGTITLPSSLDKVETAILAAALESIDRVGPCKADIKVTTIDDVRISKRKQVADRAKALLHLIMDETKDDSSDLTEEVRAAVRVEEAVTYGAERLTAGPNVSKADAIILVEGRSDVLNLLKCGIKNAIAVEGTNIPKTIRDLARDKVVTAFVDGDRGGELIMKELLQTCEVDFVARAPRNREVEELSQKAITKCLRNKIPAEQYVEMYNLDIKLEKGGMSPEKAKRLQRELDQRRTTIESRWEEEDEDDEKAPLPWDAAQRAAEHLPERGGGREPRQERGG
ncbi:MAG: DNA primase DnaG [Methanobacteriota archaeon]